MAIDVVTKVVMATAAMSAAVAAKQGQGNGLDGVVGTQRSRGVNRLRK
jgi:hypothetical protein